MHNDESLQFLLAKLQGVRKLRNGQYLALCPAHSDSSPSLSITCSEQGIGLKCFALCSGASIVQALGVQWSDLFFDSPEDQENQQKRIVARYPYKTEEGKLLFEVVRFEPKGFARRRPDHQGGWIWNTHGIPDLLYRLPDIRAAYGYTIGAHQSPIWIVEGEKDVDALWKLGIIATCNPHGAGKWHEEFNLHFINRHVVIVPDGDEAGKAHCQQVAGSLVEANAPCTLAIVRLPAVEGQKADISSYLASLPVTATKGLMGKRIALIHLMKAAPLISFAHASHMPPRLEV